MNNVSKSKSRKSRMPRHKHEHDHNDQRWQRTLPSEERRRLLSQLSPSGAAVKTFGPASRVIKWLLGRDGHQPGDRWEYDLWALSPARRQRLLSQVSPSRSAVRTFGPEQRVLQWLLSRDGRSGDRWEYDLWALSTGDRRKLLSQVSLRGVAVKTFGPEQWVLAWLFSRDGQPDEPLEYNLWVNERWRQFLKVTDHALTPNTALPPSDCAAFDQWLGDPRLPMCHAWEVNRAEQVERGGADSCLDLAHTIARQSSETAGEAAAASRNYLKIARALRLAGPQYTHDDLAKLQYASKEMAAAVFEHKQRRKEYADAIRRVRAIARDGRNPGPSIYQLLRDQSSNASPAQNMELLLEQLFDAIKPYLFWSRTQKTPPVLMLGEQVLFPQPIADALVDEWCRDTDALHRFLMAAFERWRTNDEPSAAWEIRDAVLSIAETVGHDDEKIRKILVKKLSLMPATSPGKIQQAHRNTIRQILSRDVKRLNAKRSSFR